MIPSRLHPPKETPDPVQAGIVEPEVVEELADETATDLVTQDSNGQPVVESLTVAKAFSAVMYMVMALMSGGC